MAVTDQELDRELTERLRGRGQRVTTPRLLVHRQLRRGSLHITPEQLHRELAPNLPSLSPATIYSTLELFEELGLLRRVSTPRGGIVYDTRPDAHHHLVCRRCGKVEDLVAPVGTAEAVRLAAETGFVADHAELQLVGLCRDCSATA